MSGAKYWRAASVMPKPSSLIKSGGQQLLLVGDLRERRRDDVPAIGRIAKPADRGHHCVSPVNREFHRRATDSVGLPDICLGGNVAGRALEVIGNRPMAPAAELRAYQTGDDRRDPAQLGMAEGVLDARRREELSVWSLDSFRHGNNALVVPLQGFLNFGKEPLFIEDDLG